MRAKGSEYLRHIVLGGLVTLGVCLSLTSSATGDDEFKALPGLWKTTVVTQNASSPGDKVTTWRCIDEGADPWASFAIPFELGDKSCTRLYSRRTSTSLEWRARCGSSVPTTYEGSLSFNSPDQYSGKVRLRKTNVGTDQILTVRGQRYAACTSPQD